MALTVRIVLVMGTPTYGIWCNACMTSAGVTVPLHRLTTMGVNTVTASRCTTPDCLGDLELPDGQGT